MPSIVDQVKRNTILQLNSWNGFDVLSLLSKMILTGEGDTNSRNMVNTCTYQYIYKPIQSWIMMKT